MNPIIFLPIGVTIFCGIVLLALLTSSKPSAEQVRMSQLVKPSQPDARTISFKEQASGKLLVMTREIRARLGITSNPKLDARLVSAGLRGSASGEIFFAGQLVSPLIGAFAGSFIPVNTFFWVFACALVGYLVPDMWLTRQQAARKNRIRRSLPDAIDLLVICVDAGLGLDQALLRVSQELAISHVDVNQEFTQVNREQRAGRPRLEAWQNLADRTKIEEFAAFVSMLTQTDKFGTPIIKSLSLYSEDLRLKRRQHAEEMAAKTKIKIIFPLVLCIFPCLFIVLLAPAIMTIGGGLTGMTK